MSTPSKLSLRLLLGLVLLFAGLTPLRAQLDPKLQACPTDFTDLYQQTTNNKAKPEILSIFDCSRSMASLMFHPLFQNFDNQDLDGYNLMKFVLSNGSTTAATTTYTVKAQTTGATGFCSLNTSYTITVPQPTGSVTISPLMTNPPTVSGCAAVTSNYTYTFTAASSELSTAKATVTISPNTPTSTSSTYSVSSYTASTGTKTDTTGAYTIQDVNGSTSGQTISVVGPAARPNGNWIPGDVLTVTVYMKHPYLGQEQELASDRNISWSGGPGGGTWSEVTSNLVYKNVSTWTVPASPITSGNPSSLKIAASGTLAVGNTITFTASFPTNTAPLETGVTWTLTPNTNNGTAGYNTAGINVAGTSYFNSSGLTATFKIPPVDTTPGATSGSYVTVSLDPTKTTGGYDATTKGLTYLTATLSGTTNNASDTLKVLRKPDGTPVTAADCTGMNQTPYLNGQSSGATDVRNWIRAASHARFQVSVKNSLNKSVTRTIDIPIPWKIIDPYPSGGLKNPLSSLTVTDTVIKKTYAQDGVTVLTSTSYGTGLAMELDQCYQVNAGIGAVFTKDNLDSTGGTSLGDTANTTAYLWTALYRPAYISWLFTGMWQSTTATNMNYIPSSDPIASSLVGQFIAFDALAPSATYTPCAYGQAVSSTWGAAYGPSTTPWNTNTYKVPQYKADGTYNSWVYDDPSKYKIPSVTRLQAIKQAAIQSWINYQADVLWAFRCLDTPGEAGGGTASTFSNDSTTTPLAPIASTTHYDGVGSAWSVLNNTSSQGYNLTTTESTSGNSTNGMNRIASLFAAGQTPLTYAVARSLAQYGDPSSTSVFNAVEAAADVSQCVNHYIMLFTDGLDNNGNFTTNQSASPYIKVNGSTSTLDVVGGNQTILADTSKINSPTSGYFNMFTFAGIGAHLGDSGLGTGNYMTATDPGTSVSSGAPSTFLPMTIYKRHGTVFNAPQRVTFMTMGVSLGGIYTDTTSPKYNCWLTAVSGNPASPHTGNLATDFHAFTSADWIPDVVGPPASTTGHVATGAVYYFDATDPNKLVSAMTNMFKIAAGSVGNNATASPILPFVGASLGGEVYMGNFQPPIGGGVVWPGDLLMFGTRETTTGISILDKNANPTTTLDKTTAQWAASEALANSRNWNARKLWTRVPNTGADKTNHAMVSFTYLRTPYTNVIKPLVAVGQSDNVKIQAVQFAMGGDISTVTAPTAPAATAYRSNIMGDIISSTPAAVEYKLSDVSASIANYTRLNNMIASNSGNRFRIILVGTNQGWLHCFGEVTKNATVTDSGGKSQNIVTAAVDELWSFMPTDFLSNLNWITGVNNKHKLLVDGSPSIYWLDLPSSSGGAGNGVIDAAERAIAVFGLGKGGRSYYAIDIHDPFNPSLKWSLVPDESANFDTARNLTGLDNTTLISMISNMGFSTCTPSYGRILFNSVVRDAVFLGGGFSTPLVDTQYGLSSSTTPQGLGRSVFALDVYTGDVLAAVDMTDSKMGGSSVGPVSAGLIPFEFILDSGMAQRAYFMDYWGGLWSWGNKAVSDSGTYKGFRIDNSELTGWKVRKVFQDDNNAASGKGGRYTALPAPFRVGSTPTFPVTTGASLPAAVGIAMISGDRNNPADQGYTTSNVAPVHHDLTVVFDRQDSRNYLLDTATGPDTGIVPSIGTNDLLEPLSSTKVTDGMAPSCSNPFGVFTTTCSNYYLGTGTTPKYGYYVALPSADSTTGYTAKGITPPMVLANTLFYAYFTPTSFDYCSGGLGTTTSSIIADVMNPIANDGRTGVAIESGVVNTWSGVASNYIAVGTKEVIQGGTAIVKGVTSIAVPLISTSLSVPQVRSPKARVWRTVQ